MTVNEEIIQGIKETGRQKRGMSDLVKYLEGKDLTQRQAIHAYCYHCTGYGEEDDCEQAICPLYPFAPYSSRKRVVAKPKKGLGVLAHAV